LKARELYNMLLNDFINENMKDDDWAAKMPNLDKYLFPEFKVNSGMGLMCDFTNEIKKVYTTVFLSEKVLSSILRNNISNAVIFSHHPTNWDLCNHSGYYPVEESYISKLKERNISIYILHYPLDNYSKYSTCGTLANKLMIKIEKPVFLYYNSACGVIGTTDCKNINELRERYSQAVGHETSLYLYGHENIEGEKVAVFPGAENSISVIDEMLMNNVKILITGVTLVNKWSKGTHEYEKNKCINLLGGTHYSSEKFALMEICKYFNDLGLQSEFINDEPNLFDL